MHVRKTLPDILDYPNMVVTDTFKAWGMAALRLELPYRVGRLLKS